MANGTPRTRKIRQSAPEVVSESAPHFTRVEEFVAYETTVPEPITIHHSRMQSISLFFAHFFRGRVVRRIGIGLIVIVLLALAFFAYEYFKLSSDPAIIAKEKTAKIVNEVSRAIVLPDDPNIAVAMVADKTKLEGQKFFQNAENGDYIVLVPSESRAILYRPSLHKVVDVAPFSTNPQTAGAKPAAPKVEPKAEPKASSTSGT